MTFGAGQLRNQVILQRLGTEQNEFGEPVPTWFDVAIVWAAIEPLSGREYFSAQQVNAEVTHRIRIRYLPGVTAAMRILFGDREFHIESVLNTRERDAGLVLMCIERNPEGS